MTVHDNSTIVDITSKIMGVAMIILFLVVIFILFNIFPEWFKCIIMTEEEPFTPRRRLVFTSARHKPVKKGLDPSVLRYIPLVVFQSNACEDRLDCAVCLSEVLPGEEARFLPKCNHGFHIECIDLWFQFHSTCPLCRNSLAPSTTQLTIQNNSSNHSGYPSRIREEMSASVCATDPSPNHNNVFSGDQTQVIFSLPPPLPSSSSSSSSSSTRMEDERVVIDVPMQTRYSSDTGEGYVPSANKTHVVE